jgi:general stress protein 26
MPGITPETDLDPRFGEPDATATPWDSTERLLATAEIFWLSTVRPNGRPHVTSLLAVWHDGALHICAGTDEQKTRNITGNPEVVLSTGTPALRGGLDVAVEGRATRVTDPTVLKALADAWEDKYGSDWHYDVAEGGFVGGNGLALVFRIEPSRAFGFGKGPYSQTRYHFPGAGR